VREVRAWPGRQIVNIRGIQQFYRMAQEMLKISAQCELLLGCKQLRFAKKMLW